MKKALSVVLVGLVGILIGMGIMFFFTSRSSSEQESRGVNLVDTSSKESENSDNSELEQTQQNDSNEESSNGFQDNTGEVEANSVEESLSPAQEAARSGRIEMPDSTFDYDHATDSNGVTREIGATPEWEEKYQQSGTQQPFNHWLYGMYLKSGSAYSYGDWYKFEVLHYQA